MNRPFPITRMTGGALLQIFQIFWSFPLRGKIVTAFFAFLAVALL